jgi:hypothetical protein
MKTLFEEFDKKDQNKNWSDEWHDMPSYNNEKQKEPFITATFKFRTKEDFDAFHEVVKKELYNGERVFDGMQRKNKKNAWFPLNEKASKYIVI